MSRRANIFIFFARENINSNKVDLTEKGEQKTCLNFAKYITHYIHKSTISALMMTDSFSFQGHLILLSLKKKIVAIKLRSSEQLNGIMIYQDPNHMQPSH